MNDITVRIQGETDWVSFDYKIEELDSLTESSFPTIKVSGELGNLLDNDLTSPMDTVDKNNLKELLAKYVANLSVYSTMKSKDYQSLFITSFKSAPPKNGYITRVAGAIRPSMKNIVVTSMGNPNQNLGEDQGLFILLKLISENKAYKRDKYHSKSLGKIILKQANQIGPSVGFQNAGNPQNN